MTLVFPDGTRKTARGSKPGPSATILVHRMRVVRRMLTRGDVGFAEAFMDGDWSTPDLHAVLDFGYLNEAALTGPMTASRFVAPLIRLWHRLRANTRAGSRRNIAYHYDLGNEFYRLWLDPTMTYSSAVFDDARPMSLAEAQTEKYRRIIRTLGIGPTHRVLEIGCGWGGFAEIAARETGCTVVGITLSREQAAFARQRMADAGLSDKVEIRIEDYRDVRETFDHIVSIEMFEAVGEANWPVYFAAVRDRLRPGGGAVLQIITVGDERFELYRGAVDFVQRYIFPGGMLPSKAALSREVEASGLAWRGADCFGLSYAETLHRWYDAFVARWNEVHALGFDERFRRMWSYYLAGCEASFKSAACDVGQYHLTRT
ncbi:MAG: class I SAM-dependent methyltransferase [Bauldia sp.]|nr:class I SAM-dependent methyltransferase [Bauldia sp.]